jgi:hypothetical protein
MNDKINEMTCPHCKLHHRLNFPFLCTNVVHGFALWYEPYHDPQVDEDIAQYRTHMGPDSFYAKAPRIQDWESFKKKLLEMEMASPSSDKARPVFSQEMRKKMTGYISYLSKKTK